MSKEQRDLFNELYLYEPPEKICGACEKGGLKRRSDLTPVFKEDICKALAQYRIATGVTQEDLNEKIGLGDRYITKWETAIKIPNGFNLTCWTEALGVDIVLRPRWDAFQRIPSGLNMLYWAKSLNCDIKLVPCETYL